MLIVTLTAQADKWQLTWPTYSNELKENAKIDKNANAYVDLAICYGFGLGVKYNPKKCEKMFNAICFNFDDDYDRLGKNFPYGAFWYGIFICNHDGWAKDFKWTKYDWRNHDVVTAKYDDCMRRGIDLIFAAADNGLIDAMIFAARTERNDNGRYSRDRICGGYNENAPRATGFGYYKYAMKYYQKACETGNLDAMLEYSHYLIDIVEKTSGFEDNQDELAHYWIKTAAERGNAEAQYIYGNMHRLGWRGLIPENMDTAIDWYIKSANNGYPKAMGFAGKYLLSERSSESDSLAIKYLEMGVANSDGEAACVLGKYFKSNMPEKAFTYFLKSGENNHPEGLWHLAYCYKDGIGTPKNLELAAKAFEQGASLETNHLYVGKCAAEIAQMYEKGIGVFMNKDKASHYRWIAQYYNL